VILTHRFDDIDNRQLANVCGDLDAHLHALAARLGVTLSRRGEQFRIEGPAGQARRAAATLDQLRALADQPIAPQAVELILVQAAAGLEIPGVAAEPASAGAGELKLHTRRHDLAARTPNQQRYLQQILAHDLTLGVGPAGTGKTYLAVACAVDALERHQVQRIVLTRPAVEAGERLGFLPGDLAQKVDPYLRPLFDALFDLMGFDKVAKAQEKGLLEVAPLAFMRGRTLADAFVILDEAQNTTIEQMKMFLTRLGFGSKAVVTGDITQVDLPRQQRSGLRHAIEVLRGVEGVAFTFFNALDVVRHPLVQRIVQAYERNTDAEDARDR
jgi:phosphate starvation-inducible PhoH-like protein